MSDLKQSSPTTLGIKQGGFAKKALTAAVTIAMGGLSNSVTADLNAGPGAVLNFTAGTPTVTGCLAGNLNTAGTSCTLGSAVNVTDMAGSYFSMDQSNPGVEPHEKTAISEFAPLSFGSAQVSSGAHTGTVPGGEAPSIDNPWGFFFNTGMHNNTAAAIDMTKSGATRSVDLSGWGVNWGGFDTSSSNTISMPGTATLVCSSASCADGDTYTLDMAVHVPVAFTSVPYTLHLEGTVSLPGVPPTANDDNAITIIDNPVTIDVLANDNSADPLVDGSINISPNGTIGTAVANANTADPNDDTVTYTPNAGVSGTDTFDYTVDNTTGGTSNSATVTVDIQTNVAPVAADDTATVNTATLDIAPLVVDILNNDSDPNNTPPGSPGGLDLSSLSVVPTPTPNVGTCGLNAQNNLLYSQTPPSVPGTYNCTYSISDIDPVNGPLSDTATVQITVTGVASDWPAILPTADTIPLLAFDAGVPGANTQVPITQGSYFTMRLSPTDTVFTPLVPGPDGGMIIGYEQPAFGSHVGEPLPQPNNIESPSMDQPWTFFSNTGFTYTSNGGVVGNPDGTLQFGGTFGQPREQGVGRYIITWGGTPAIDLGGDTSGVSPDLRFAIISCNPAPCADGSSFSLDYNAIVPPDETGLPNGGFGGVPYGLHLEGTVRFLNGTATVSGGSLSSFSRVNATQVTADTEVDYQCSGSCVDYTITGVSGQTSIVIPLAGAVPVSPVWRLLDNGVWRNFNEANGDTVRSAPLLPNGTDCPPSGHASFRSLTPGDQCVELRVTDNTGANSATATNDLDPTPGTVSDPGGLGSGGAAGGGAVFVDNRPSSTSGCTIAGNTVQTQSRGTWWLLAGFISWLGLQRRFKRH